MACCLFLLRLLAPLAHRLGIGSPVTRAPRLPVVPIALLGLAEVGIALLVVPGLRGGSAAEMTGHLHHLAPATSGGVRLGTFSALLFTGVIAVLALQVARRTSSAVGIAGAAALVGAAVFAVTSAAGSSHALMMVVVEVALVLGPLGIVGTTVNLRPADDIWVVARAALTLTTTAAATFLLVTLHLPTTHHWYVGAEGLRWWLAPLLAATGLAFWGCVLRFRLPATWRALLLVGVLETGAVIGLTLLVARQGLTPMGGFLELGVVADQRLAGALMMVVDAVLLIRVVDRVIPVRAFGSQRPVEHAPGGAPVPAR